MLKKLIRYEWKAVSGINALLAAIATGVCLFGMIYLQTPMWREMLTGGSSHYSYVRSISSFQMLLSMGAVFIYVVMLIGVMFGQMIYFGVRYYGSMFSDQGYLTHTLPVKPEELLISKVFTAGCWTLLINFLLIVLSGILIIAGICGVADVTLAEVLDNMGEVARYFFVDIYRLTESEAYLKLLLSILVMLLNPFLTTAILFGALTLGHYSGKNKGLMGILSYFGVLFVRALLKNLVAFCLGVTLARFWRGHDRMAQSMSSYSIFLVDILLAAGLMIWSHHILKKRLNME